MNNDVKTIETGDILERIAEIKGLDVAQGLARVAQRKEVYKKILLMFVGKIPAFVENTENASKARDVQELIAQIHGIKGVLGNIGAVELYELAMDMEMSLKSNNLENCLAYLPGFITKLQNLGEALSSILTEPVQTVNKPSGDISMLKSGINELYTALEEFDFNKVSDVLEKLSAFDFGTETGKHLAKIKIFIERFDYDSVIEYIRRLPWYN